jgi:poly(A)-specific ribonuclease
MDLEMTGLHKGGDTRNSYMDSFQHRYSKQKESFLPNQFGLSTFTWDSESNSFACAIYSFSIFPSHKYTKDIKFLSEGAALCFLAENKFDFNKWIHEGISFMTYEDENVLRDQLNVNKQEEEGGEVKEVREYDAWALDFITSIMKEIEEWEKTDQTEWLSPRKLNKFRRTLVTKEVKKKFGEDTIYVFEDTSDDNFCEVKLVRLANPSEREKINRQIDETNNEVINEAVGFRFVIDSIIGAKKPVLTHNGFYDLLHTYNRFIGYLPDTLNKWKERLNELIPLIIDTKQLSSHPLFGDVFGKKTETMLQDVYKFMTKTNPQFSSIMPKLTFDTRFPESPSQAHDAGYDAFMTGVIFIGLYQHITKLNFNSFTTDHPEIENYVNRIPLNGYGFDVVKPNLNFAGEDQTPVCEKEVTFYVIGYDQNVKMERIEKHFADYENARLRLTFIYDFPHVHVTFPSPLDEVTLERLINRDQEFWCVPFGEYCLMKTYAEQEENPEGSNEEEEDGENKEEIIEENQEESEEMVVDNTGQNSLKRKRDDLEENDETEPTLKKMNTKSEEEEDGNNTASYCIIS